MCNFFVVPGNGQALLAIPDIEILNILTISCNTIHTEEANKDANCHMNTPHYTLCRVWVALCKNKARYW